MSELHTAAILAQEGHALVSHLHSLHAPTLHPRFDMQSAFDDCNRVVKSAK